MASRRQNEVQINAGSPAMKTILAVSISSILFNTQALAKDTSVKQTEVVTVIGEKVERTIFETSSSVRVYDESTLESTPNATQLDDLLQLTPNMVDVGQGNSLPSIRGVDGSGPSVGGIASFAGTAPRLNLSIDGRSLTYSEIAFGPRSLWDIEQVEVHLGPQSYVQGRNSSAGAIVIKSNDPIHEFETRVKSGYGEHGYSQNSIVVNTPIVQDQLAFRLSVDQQKRLTALPLASYEPAGDSRRVETTVARAKLLIEPDKFQGLSSVLAVDFSDTRSPQSENDIGMNYAKERAVYETKSTNGIWNVEWQLNDAFTFENRLIVTEFEYERITQPGENHADFTTEGNELSVEPLVRYHTEQSNLSGLFGLRYFSSDQDDEFLSSGRGFPMGGETKTASAFGEATYRITPMFDVTFAGRFEQENKTRQADLKPRFTIDSDEDVSVFLPKLEVAYRPELNQTIGFKAGKGYNNGGAGVSFNTSNGRAPMKAYEFDEEYVWNYEFYTRHGLADGTVTLTSNWFYNDYDGMQIQQSQADGYVLVQNLDDAKTYGAEVAVDWMATADLELMAAVGLLKTDYTQTVAEGGENKELPRAPAFSASLSALYHFSDGFEASANANYTGAYYSDLSNDESLRIDPKWIVNTQISYVFKNGRANLFAQNLFNDNSVTDIGDKRYINEPLRQTPRTVGASLELFF